MAFVESGTLGRYPAADECLAHPDQYGDMGVTGAPVMMVNGEKVEVSISIPPLQFGDVVFRLFRHPDLLVSDTCRLWLEEYKVKTKYGSRLEYDDFHPCYLQAERIYSNFMKGLDNAKSSKSEDNSFR
jgi:hypothetical protein